MARRCAKCVSVLRSFSQNAGFRVALMTVLIVAAMSLSLITEEMVYAEDPAGKCCICVSGNGSAASESSNNMAEAECRSHVSANQCDPQRSAIVQKEDFFGYVYYENQEIYESCEVIDVTFRGHGQSMFEFFHNVNICTSRLPGPECTKLNVRHMAAQPLVIGEILRN